MPCSRASPTATSPTSSTVTARPSATETVASCDYDASFTAVASRGNFHGAQFHPERSAALGARFLANFLELS